MKTRRERRIGRRGKIALALLVSVMFIGVASAAVLTHYNTITTTATVSQSVLVDGKDITEPITQNLNAIGGGTYCFSHWLKNNAPIEATVQFDSTYSPALEDEEIKTTYLTAGLEVKRGDEIAEWSTMNVFDGISSVHLDTNDVAQGGEGRIVMPLVDNTLDDIDTISWWEYLVEAGYPPHVDIIIETSTGTDALVIEYAYNNPTATTQPTYGAVAGEWYQTFNDDGAGPTEIDDSSYAWLSSGPAGGPGIIGGTLAEWKAGTVFGDPHGIDGTTPVLRLEIEVDNWMTETEAYVDNVEINGDLHEPEDISSGITLEPGQTLYFYICYEFAINIVPQTYTITTEIQPVIPT